MAVDSATNDGFGDGDEGSVGWMQKELGWGAAKGQRRELEQLSAPEWNRLDRCPELQSGKGETQATSMHCALYGFRMSLGQCCAGAGIPRLDGESGGGLPSCSCLV